MQASVDARFEGGIMDGMLVFFAVAPGMRVAYAPLAPDLHQTFGPASRVPTDEIARIGPATADRWPGAEVYEVSGIEPGPEGGRVVYRLAG